MYDVFYVTTYLVSAMLTLLILYYPMSFCVSVFKDFIGLPRFEREKIWKEAYKISDMKNYQLKYINLFWCTVFVLFFIFLLSLIGFILFGGCSSIILLSSLAVYVILMTFFSSLQIELIYLISLGIPTLILSYAIIKSLDIGDMHNKYEERKLENKKMLNNCND